MTVQCEKKNLMDEMADLQAKIESVTHYQRPYIANLLRKMAQMNAHNTNVICDYIIAEQNEINIKESTKEGKIKCLVALSTYLNHKAFNVICKEDILDYLTSLKKPVTIDPHHKSIGTYNGRQMILLKFFRWLYNPSESDSRKRTTPVCMKGIKRLPREEKSPYKPSDLWLKEEHEIFLKYCPSERDKAFHAMAFDTSARPHELLNLHIGDIFFKKAPNGVQYAEVLVSGKTKSRTLPLITSVPYVKSWIQSHPQGTNSRAWLFVSLSRQNHLGQITRDGLLKKYEQYYKKRFFPMLLEQTNVPDRDKAYIRNMLTKPFSLYIFRHTALTHKSSFLKEHILRDHAGWSTTSKMPEVYIHYFGTESSNSILEAYGIVKNDSVAKNLLMPIYCPNCSEPNKNDATFCCSCKMVLKYAAYNQTISEQKKREVDIELLKERFSKEMINIRKEIMKDVKGQIAELVTRIKPEIIKQGIS